ncbi:cytochrome P450 [Russula compacta]|nr:cytochrome P450 [Russula compacta]
MPSLNALPFSLLEDLKSSLLLALLNVQYPGTLSIGAILGLIFLYAIHYCASPYRKLPPGPRGYPIIGNLLELTTEQWVKFAEWRNKYGDLIYLNAAGQPIVVLNSQKVAVDLLDRRAGIYSDRPRNIVACDIMTGGLFFALSGWGDVWHRLRKAASEGLSKNAVKKFYERQTTEAILLACDWLADPAQWDRHLRRASVSTILSVIYGYPTVTSEDRTVEIIDDFAERITLAAYPGTYLVEFFPWMRRIPSSLASWKRVAENWYKQDSATFEGLLRTIEADITKGDVNQSLITMLLREVKRYKLSSRERSWLAATMYVAGTDTTATAMAWWTLAIVAYPETQARAHAELDAVVGRSRLPTFADYPHLPYIRAMAKEVLRWRPVGPLGLPHRSIEDDWYEGMFIPKGTICIPNVWNMNHDPGIYGESVEKFDPARHLDAKMDTAPGLSDTAEEGRVTFGFGRRQCVGRHLANNLLFIEMATVLWATRVQRKKDPSGQFLPLDVDGFVDQGVSMLVDSSQTSKRPVPFDCEILPRFPEAPALLAQERELRGL